MSRSILSARASRDIDAIVAFIAGDSIDAALRMIDEFYDACALTFAHPGIGHVRPDLINDDHVRFWSVRAFLLIYRVFDSKPIVVRVVDGRRDVPNIQLDND